MPALLIATFPDSPKCLQNRTHKSGSIGIFIKILGPEISVFSFINLFIYFYLFNFGCTGSSLLRTGFLQLRRVGATIRCGARASHCGGFSCCGAWAACCSHRSAAAMHCSRVVEIHPLQGFLLLCQLWLRELTLFLRLSPLFVICFIIQECPPFFILASRHSVISLFIRVQLFVTESSLALF